MATNLGINLLKNRRSLSEDEYLREHEIMRYSVVGVVMLVMVAVAALLFQLISARQLAGIESSIANATSRLAGYTEANAQQIYLKSRLKLLSTFLDEREVYRKSLQAIFSLAIPGVYVSGVSFEEDNVMKTEFTSDSVLSLEKVIDYLSEPGGFFVQASTKGVIRTNEGSYQVQAMLTIPKESGDK